jgi:hypothetical protein
MQSEKQFNFVKEKIGVFGDSYVDPVDLRMDVASQALSKHALEKYKVQIESEFVIWHELLSSLGNYKTTAHARGGCDQYYIYKQFLDNHAKYDRNIVVLTNETRYSFKSWEANGDWIHGTNAATCKVKSVLPEYKAKQRVKYRHLGNYIEQIFLDDLDRCEIINDALIAQMKALRPDTLFINAFHKNIEPLSNSEKEQCLHAITRYEQEQLGNLNSFHIKKTYDPDQKVDCRIAHMTEPSHRILARQVARALDRKHTSLAININEYHRKFHDGEFERYWQSPNMIIKHSQVDN